MIREDIYNVVERIDKVCDAAEACCDFFLDQRPEIPEELKSQFLRVTQESFCILGPLKEAMVNYFGEGGKVKVIREKAKQVGIKESDVDKIEWDLTGSQGPSETLSRHYRGDIRQSGRCH